MFTVLLFTFLIFISPKPVHNQTSFPWEITITPEGNPKVFGLTLNKSTLEKAIEIFQISPEMKLFENNAGRQYLEAYFKNVETKGIRAKVIVNIEIPEEKREVFRISNQDRPLKPNEEIKSPISDHQQSVALYLPISTISYLPSVQLDAKLLEMRFGHPLKIVKESATIEHWQYPSRGLNIIVNHDGKDVIQYTSASTAKQNTTKISH